MVVQKRDCSVVAIGKFEGVHLGHQKILRLLNQGAKEKNCEAVALTFLNNPLSVLKPEVCPKPIMSPAQREEELKTNGADRVFMIPFTQEISSLSPEEFIVKYLVTELNAKHVIVGGDFKFGNGAAGNTKTLEEAGVRYGFTVEVINDVLDPALGRISSTKVRELLASGDVSSVAKILGKPHRVRGAVVHGDARGRQLGFPTANLGSLEDIPLEGMVPQDGVYAGWVVLGEEKFGAAISVGNNPTFTPEEQSRVEAFILDFDRDIYGSAIEVLFLEKVRDTETFDSIETLLAAMHKDIERVRRLVSSF